MEESLGQYIKRLRKEKMLTLRAVEEKTEISNAYLSQIESGKITKPSPSVLYKLAKCYDVPYEQLMKLAGFPIVESEKENAFRTSKGFENVTEEEKKELLDYLQFIRARRLRK